MSGVDDCYSRIRSWWGVEPSSTLADVVARAPLDQVESFASSYVAQSVGDSTPPIRPGHTRPYPQLYTAFDRLYRDDRTPLGTDRVSALSLYAHECLLNDPVGMACISMFLPGSAALGEEVLRKNLRQSLIHLSDMQPLHEVGAIIFSMQPMVERLYVARNRPAFTREQLATLADIAPRLAARLIEPSNDYRHTEANLAYFLEEVGVGLVRDLPHTRRPRANNTDIRTWVGVAVQELFDTIRANNELGGRLQLFVPNSIALQLIEWMVRYGMISRPPDAPMLDLFNIASLTTPVLLPSVETLARVRRDSEAFASWRQALTQALKYAEELDYNDDNWFLEARGAVHDGLSAPRERLLKEIEGSRTLSSAWAGSTELLLAALGVAAGTAAGDAALPAVAAAGATVGGGYLLRWVANMRTQLGRKALLEHYMSFGDIQ